MYASLGGKRRPPRDGHFIWTLQSDTLLSDIFQNAASLVNLQLKCKENLHLDPRSEALTSNSSCMRNLRSKL